MSTPILLVLPFHNGDVDLAKMVLQWMDEIESENRPVRRHSILLAADATVPEEKRKELWELAKKSFASGKVVFFTVKATEWPKSSNEMFLRVSKYIHDGYKLPFLWFEPDCVPLAGNWLDQIADAYAACPNKFMGPLIASDQAGLPPLHLTGCSVYPPDAYAILKEACESGTAWDIASADRVVGDGRARNTQLIQHCWGKRDLPPTFALAKTPESAINVVTPAFLQPQAVMFHRCKDGSLIQVLRQLQSARNGESVGAEAPTPEKPTALPGRKPTLAKGGRKKKPEAAPFEPMT